MTQGEGGTGIDRALVEGTGTEETTTGISTAAGSGRGRSSSGSAAPSPVTGPPSPVTTSRVTAVTVSSLTARTDGKGVLISWKTGHEVNNLGFHVWREEAGQRIRLTREPLAGGALTVGNTHVDAGHSYSFCGYRRSPVTRSRGHGTTWRISISTGPGPCMVR